jgi:uncharacterized integral membrane protein
MLTLIVTVLFGLVIALFAMQNTSGANIHIAQYNFTHVPLYLIMIGSLLVGLLISWVISLLNGVASFFTLQGKEHTIKNADKTIAQLEERVHALEKENARLQGHEDPHDIQKESIAEDTQMHRPNIFQRLKYSIR